MDWIGSGLGVFVGVHVNDDEHQCIMSSAIERPSAVELHIF